MLTNELASEKTNAVHDNSPQQIQVNKSIANTTGNTKILNTAFIENPSLSISYRSENNPGIVYVEDNFPNLLFAKDGEVYDLDGQKALVIGGAYSVDKWYRLRMDMNWFPDEQPSDEIKRRVMLKLEELNWKVDVVLSHTCPERYIPIEAFLSGIDQSTVDSFVRSRRKCGLCR